MDLLLSLWSYFSCCFCSYSVCRIDFKPVKAHLAKYFTILTLSFLGEAVYVHGKERTIIQSCAEHYMQGTWLMRLFVITVTIDTVKIMLILLMKKIDLGNAKHSKLRAEYDKILHLCTQINEVSTINFAVVSIQFRLIVVNISYWNILGILKNFNLIAIPRKYMF